MTLTNAKQMYKDEKLITFGLTIGQMWNDNLKKYSKSLVPPKGWQKFDLDNDVLNSDNNALGMITGKINNIFVIDIDNISNWKYLLDKTKQEEPKTVTAISGNGGKHLFFKYTCDLDSIKSKSQAIIYEGKTLAIDEYLSINSSNT